MSRFIKNIDAIEYTKWGQGEKYEAQLGRVSVAVGAKQLGYNVTILPPGKAAFPLHCHRVNEEMFFVLDGSGELRLGNDRFKIRQGDFIACPAGGPTTAHQIINTSDQQELRFLAVSTSLSPEIAEYPDSGKTGVIGQFSHGTEGQPEMLRFMLRAEDGKVDYWDGE